MIIAKTEYVSVDNIKNTRTSLRCHSLGTTLTRRILLSELCIIIFSLGYRLFYCFVVFMFRTCFIVLHFSCFYKLCFIVSVCV